MFVIIKLYKAIIIICSCAGVAAVLAVGGFLVYRHKRNSSYDIDFNTDYNNTLGKNPTSVYPFTSADNTAPTYGNVTSTYQTQNDYGNTYQQTPNTYGAAATTYQQTQDAYQQNDYGNTYQQNDYADYGYAYQQSQPQETYYDDYNNNNTTNTTNDNNTRKSYDSTDQIYTAYEQLTPEQLQKSPVQNNAYTATAYDYNDSNNQYVYPNQTEANPPGSPAYRFRDQFRNRDNVDGTEEKPVSRYASYRNRLQ